MSTLYNLEPQPTAKVVLHTTSGDIAVELFGQQAPLATRNFLQHCLDGYYDNTVFHRLVPDFIIQGGDPTGTGSGGQSSYDNGAPFADEFHSRLKFNRRGLLGMANAGSKDDNGSQFFFTLGKTEELNGRNTMFGRVEGSTIYNLVKMGEAELLEGHSERPVYPTMIKNTEILVNPFETMVRNIKGNRGLEDKKAAPQKKTKSKKKSAGKQMLSFADANDDDVLAEPVHSIPKYNPALVEAAQPKTVERSTASRSARLEIRRAPAVPTPESPQKLQAPRQLQSAESPSSTTSPSPEPEGQRRDKMIAEADAHIAKLKQSLKSSTHETLPPERRQKRSVLDDVMPAGVQKAKKRKTDGKSGRQAISDFNAFKARLDAANSQSLSTQSVTGSNAAPEQPSRDTAPGIGTSDNEEETEACELHLVPSCQSCQKWDAVETGADDDANHEGVLSHRLTFAKDRLGKDLEWKRQNEKELVVIDPREREKDFLKDRRRGKK